MNLSEIDWRHTHKFDDLIPEKERNEIKEIKNRWGCTFLGKKGNWFYYCTKVPGSNLDTLIKKRDHSNPRWNNLICTHAVVSLEELKDYCKNIDEFKQCPFYKEFSPRFATTLHND